MKFGVIILPSHRWNDARLPSEWADEIALIPRCSAKCQLTGVEGPACNSLWAPSHSLVRKLFARTEDSSHRQESRER